MKPHYLYRLIVGFVLLVPFVAAAVVLKACNLVVTWKLETISIGGEDIL